MTTHHDYEGLAAGYALHALEPEEEQLLSAHLLSCQSCARLVGDTAAVGTAFAEGIVVETPPPGLRAAILAAAAAEPRVPGARHALDHVQASDSARDPDPPTHRAPERTGRVIDRGARASRFRRLQTRSRVAVGALAAAVGIAVAVPVTLAVSNSGSGGSGGSGRLATALLQPNAREVSLSGSAKTAVAKAVVSDSGIYFLASGMPVNDTAKTVYVLWAANKAGDLVPVQTFDVSSGKPVAVDASKVPFKAGDISAVAVSYERGRTAPKTPSHVVLTSA